MRKGVTADRVVDAALEWADEHGIETLTMAAVARVLDVQVPTLYGHVGTVTELHTLMTLRALEEMADELGDGVAGRSGHEALRALADAYRDYAHRRPGAYAAARLPVDHAVALRSAGPRHVSFTAAVLRGYALPDDEHVHAIRLLGSTIHGFIESEAAGSYSHSSPDADSSWERIVDALDASLRHWPYQR